MINFERLIYMRQPFLRKVLTGILMRELSQRTSQFTDSVIRRMTRVANKYGAVNLSQGFPDFDPPVAITDMWKYRSYDGSNDVGCKSGR